jgi:CxxC motif-containing protein (DUF1111 family)
LPNPDCGSNQTGCGASSSELSDTHLNNLVKYISLLGVRPQRNYNDADVERGKTLFGDIGCVSCHTPSVVTSAHHPLAELRSQTIQPYTDLLLHDMGEGLADAKAPVEGQATRFEWRTAPLWSLGLSACVTGGITGVNRGDAGPKGVDGEEICVPKASYLHDGRATTIEQAILWHGGEGLTAKNKYTALNSTDKQKVIKFLESL